MADKTIATLVTKFLADTTGFERGAKRAQSHLSRFTQSSLRMQQQLRRMAGAVLAVAGIGGIGYMVKRTMDGIDATAKLSDRLGMATEDLTALQHGAALSGVAVEQLSTALMMMQRNIGQGATVFERLGLSGASFAGRDAAQSLALIADRMNALPDASRRVAAGMEIFGRGGGGMVTLVERGSAGLRAMRKDVEDLGAAFSRIDARKVEAANDAIRRTRTAMAGIMQDVVIQLAPGMAALANMATKWITSRPDLGADIAAVAEKVVVTMLKLTGAIIDLTNELVARSDALKALMRGGPTRMLVQVASDWWTKDASAAGVNSGTDEAIADVQGWFARFREESERVARQAEEMRQRWTAPRPPRDLFGQGVNELSFDAAMMDDLRKMRDATMDEIAVMEHMGDSFDKMAKPLAEFALKAYRTFGYRTGEAEDAIADMRTLLQLQTAMEERRQALEDLRDKEDRAEDVGRRGGLGFADPADLWRQIAEQINRVEGDIEKRQLDEQKKIKEAVVDQTKTIERLLPTVGALR